MPKHLLLLGFLALLLVPPVMAQSLALTTSAVTSDETARCLNCHAQRQPKLVEQWESDVHAREGVGCFECHATERSDPAARAGHFSFAVKLQVSPLKCGECHEEQYDSFASSSHAIAYDTIKDHPLASESPILFETSCAACHGNETRMLRGRPQGYSWPNHGIGRINSDGSRGNCSACHGHHDYSLVKVRSPETCGKCHHGQVGPAYEAWQASTHGSNHRLTTLDADLAKPGFVPLNENVRHPDCYLCHMAPTSEKANNSTHNPGDRLSWNLAALDSKFNENWGMKRLNMQAACRNCHGNSQVDQFYRRLDASVMEFNRLASSATALNDCPHAHDKIKGAIIAGKLGAAMLSPAHIRQAFETIKQIR